MFPRFELLAFTSNSSRDLGLGGAVVLVLFLDSAWEWGPVELVYSSALLVDAPPLPHKR